MRTHFLAASVTWLALSVLAGCTVNTYGNGQHEVKAGVPQEGPTSNPADVSHRGEGDDMP
ncbi:hypothetical protein [Salinicola peritrichatus]|uniref:hypothetical protein n=1 Tax=Salinicola peritrichatus TaxID=1267424 RepID=UPI000DA15D55|nr:hypothetical protein [Salinicola peritrichatus]